MTALLGVLTLSVMTVLALRANRRFAGHSDLPMQITLKGDVAWRAPRALALAFLPALAAVIFLPFALLVPDTLVALIASASLLFGQVVYHQLVARSL